MLKWSTSHPLPRIPSENTFRSPGLCHLLNIENNLWILEETLYDDVDIRLEIFVFDTTSHEKYRINVPFPDFVENSYIRSISSIENKIYIWWSNENIFTLAKLDTKTTTFEKVMDVKMEDILNDSIIKNDIMYVLGKDDEDEDKVFLSTISLSEKKVVKKLPLTGYFERNPILLSNNDKLYLSTVAHTVRRIYEIKDDGEVEQFQANDFDPEDQHLEVASEIFQTYQFIGSKSLDHLDTFNFSDNEWFRRPVENPLDKLIHWKTPAIDIDGIIYALIETVDELGIKLSIQVLEVKPKLSSICLQNLVEEILPIEESEKVGAIKAKVPEPLRAKLDNMIEWRSDKIRVAQLHAHWDNQIQNGEF